MALHQFERQKVWCGIRVLQDFAIAQLVDFCNQVPDELKICDLDPKATKNYVWALRRYGFVDWQKTDADNTEFTLVRDTGGLAPQTRVSGIKDHNIGAVEDVSQKIWNAFCLLNLCDADQLASAALAVKGSVSRYTRLLVAAEYARVEPRDVRIVGNRNRYQLIKKTGAIAPLFLDNGRVFDSNLFLQELWALSKKFKRVRA